MVVFMIDLRLRRYSRITAAALFCLTGGLHIAHGAEVDVEFRLGGTYSDNAARVNSNVTSDTIVSAGLWLDVSEITKRFDGWLKANIDHNVYTEDTFDDETFASFAGVAEVQLMPRVFSWVVANRFDKLRTDPFQADTPTNRENVNRFSTGPNLNLRLGNVTVIRLDGRYKKTRYEISDFDNDVLSGSISLIRMLSAARSISLNVTADRFEYDDSDLYSNFDLQSASLAIQSRVSRGELSAAIGVNQIHDNGITFDGSLANITWNRKISSASSFSLGYDQRFSESGDLFERYQEINKGNDTSLPVLGSANPLEISRSSVSYQFNKERNGVSFSFSHSQLDYEMDDFLDRDISALRINIQRKLGAAWHARLGGRASRTEYDQSEREDDDLELSLTIRRQLTRTLSVNLRARYIERDSNAAGFNYEENRYTLQVVYAPRAQQ